MSRCVFCNQPVPAKAAQCPTCGAALFEADAVRAVAGASSATQGDVVSMLQQGRQGDAVRIYREQTGAGLRAAIDAVDRLGRVEQPRAAGKYAASAAVDAELDADLWALLQNGQKNEAIAFYRTRTGATLRKAKEAVEAVAGEHGVAVQGAGCFSVLVLCLALPGLLVRLIR